MQNIQVEQWQKLPEIAQQELHDFYIFLKQRYTDQDIIDTQSLSNHTANLIDDWQEETEDAIWK